FDQLCVACHGLSVLVQGRLGDESHAMLFDVGPYGDVWIDNAKRLDIDLAGIETIVLSHWHWDHSGGLPTVSPAVSQARRPPRARLTSIPIGPTSAASPCRRAPSYCSRKSRRRPR